MARILIVEDSEIDRILVRSLLENQDQLEDVEVEAVEHAEAALQRAAERAPDAVVTDLVLPGIDGIGLIDAMRRDHPLVPVVVITSRGSEETAVRALQSGAASYVPKNKLAELLVETLDTVLTAASRRRGRAGLMQVMIESRQSFELANDRKLFRPLLLHLQDTMTEFGLFDEHEAMRACVAIEEALNNAAEHGNLELDSAMRERDFRGYVELLRRRCDDPLYRDRRVHFEAHFTPRRSVFSIRDEGRGFDPGELPAPGDPERLLAASGRGLTLMHSFMDEVKYNDTGNEVRMVKRRAAAAEPVPGPD